MNKTFTEKYGPWAVIAGASEGLGAAYADAIAGRGLNLVLIARRKELLDQLKADLSVRHGIEVRTLVQDLSEPHAHTAIVEATNDFETGLLIYNAAYSVIGSFLNQDADHHRRTIQVNCTMPVNLVHHFGLQMKARKKGGVILMSSLSAYQGSPLIAAYAASKSFNRILAESLWFEFKQYKVDVLGCMAGATATPNYIKSDPKKTGKLTPAVLPPKKVVDHALHALGKQPVVIPGKGNYMAANFMRRVLPTKSAISIMGKTTAEMYPENP